VSNKSDRRSEIVKWLDEDFIGSFERDVDPRIWSVTTDGHERGFFAITLLSLAYCDAMARLLKGEAEGTINTVRLIEEHHGNLGTSTDSRYQSRAAAMFTLFRHRLAHQREPGKLQIGKSILIWRLSRDRDREEHLKLVPISKKQEFCFTVDADLLFEDTRDAFKGIRDRCRSEDALVTKIRNGRKSIQSPRPMRAADSKNERIVEKIAEMLKSPDEQG
jgi:hypothetical protein